MDRSSFDFKEILDRYLRGEASDEEKTLLFRFYEEYGGDTVAELTREEEEALLKNFRKRAGVESAGIIRRFFLNVYSRAAILILVAGSILFLTSRKHEEVLAAIKTGSGEVRKVMLPDSSLVTLNARSSIRFNKDDFEQNREITLDGEALFQVVHNDKHPFIVHTWSGLYVQDVGTEFVIDNYATLPDIKISVLSGLVRVGKQDRVYGTLKRNEEIRYNLAQGTVKRDSLEDPSQCIAWSTGQWFYNNMTLSDLKTLLGNNYNITVINRTKGGEEPFVEADLNFSKVQKPAEILNIFSLATKCHYRWVSKDSVEIY